MAAFHDGLHLRFAQERRQGKGNDRTYAEQGTCDRLQQFLVLGGRKLVYGRRDHGLCLVA